MKKPREAPHRNLITRWVEAFRGGSLGDQRKNNPGRPPTAVTDLNINKVNRLILKKPNISTRRGAQLVDVSRTSYMRILDLLGLHPYKIQILQKIPSTAIPKRLSFADEMLRKLKGEVELDKIWTTD